MGDDIGDVVAGGNCLVGKHWTTKRRYGDGVERSFGCRLLQSDGGKAERGNALSIAIAEKGRGRLSVATAMKWREVLLSIAAERGRNGGRAEEGGGELQLQREEGDD